MDERAGAVAEDRAEPSEHVGSKPISALAQNWAVSDRGLAKACDRLKIPTPPRGYWQKRKAGREVSRPKLLEIPERPAEEIVIRVAE